MRWDDDDDNEFQEYDINAEILEGDYAADLVNLAEQHIKSFFKGKEISITIEKMCSPKYVSLVMNTVLGDAITKAYYGLEKRIDPEVLRKAEKTGAITEDIILVRCLLDTLAREKVPRELAGGLLLLHLEFCEGVDFS